MKASLTLMVCSFFQVCRLCTGPVWDGSVALLTYDVSQASTRSESTRVLSTSGTRPQNA